MPDWLLEITDQARSFKQKRLMHRPFVDLVHDLWLLGLEGAMIEKVLGTWEGPVTGLSSRIELMLQGYCCCMYV